MFLKNGVTSHFFQKIGVTRNAVPERVGIQKQPQNGTVLETLLRVGTAFGFQHHPASSAAAALLRRCKLSAAMCMDSMLPNRERNTGGRSATRNSAELSSGPPLVLQSCSSGSRLKLLQVANHRHPLGPTLQINLKSDGNIASAVPSTSAR